MADQVAISVFHAMNIKRQNQPVEICLIPAYISNFGGQAYNHWPEITSFEAK